MPIAILLIAILSVAFSCYARSSVKRAYLHNSKIPSRSGVTGGEAAAQILQQSGIDIYIYKQDFSNDHYDPDRMAVVLSPESFYGTNLQALGVAAHEAAHAIQHQYRYFPMILRLSIQPAVRHTLFFVPIFLLATVIFPPAQFFCLGLILGAYLFLVFFQTLTAFIEADASQRAHALLFLSGILESDEMQDVRQAYDAAFLTYVAASFSAPLGLAYLLSPRRR